MSADCGGQPVDSFAPCASVGKQGGNIVKQNTRFRKIRNPANVVLKVHGPNPDQVTAMAYPSQGKQSTQTNR